MIKFHSVSTLFKGQKLYHINGERNLAALAQSKVKAIAIFDISEHETPPNITELLNKLFLACQFKLDEMLFVNRHLMPKLKLGDLQSRFAPSLILVFGNILSLPNITGLSKNIVLELNGLKIIYTDDVLTFEKNQKGEKGKLWSNLQKSLAIK